MTSNVNVVLVHGGWVDGSSWSKVIRLLQKKGYHVSAAQIAMNSLTEDIALLEHLLTLQRAPTVLVGHSYGGAVVSGVTNSDSIVKALVFIAGSAIDEGDSLESLSKQGDPASGVAQVWADDTGLLWLKTEGFHEAFAADLSEEEAAILSVVQRPLSYAAFTQKGGPPLWRKLPSWYLISQEDRMIHPDSQAKMAKRMGATTHSLAASHASIISQPHEVADFIERAARQSNGRGAERPKAER
jgi:pimeloyl-ACP methyl ester carboxylesterase